MQVFLPIESIRVSERQRFRVAQEKVERHIAEIQRGDVMPIVCAPLGDGTYIIRGNGRHRYFAYLAEGFPSVPAEIAA